MKYAISYCKRFLLILITLCTTSPNLFTAEKDSSNISSRNLAIAISGTVAYYGLSMYLMGNTWYKDKEVVPFHFRNDNKSYLQVDKFGHIYGAYIYSYVGYHGLKKLGLNETESLIYGGSLGLLLQTPIELMDAIHEDHGFSWGDMIANALGSALVISQQLIFEEQLVKYKFTYWQSKYSEISNGYLGTTSFSRIFKDYNGHTYWLSLPIKTIIPSEKIPDWLNVAVGYGAGGMFGEFENIPNYNGVEIPITERYRRIMLSLDIDWTRIKTESTFLKTILDGLTFIKMPFPAIEFNSKNEIRFHLIYY